MIDRTVAGYHVPVVRVQFTRGHRTRDQHRIPGAASSVEGRTAVRECMVFGEEPRSAFLSIYGSMAAFGTLQIPFFSGWSRTKHS